MIRRAFCSSLQLKIREFPHFVSISNIDICEPLSFGNKKEILELFSAHKIIHFQQNLNKATQLSSFVKQLFGNRLQKYPNPETKILDNEMQLYIVEDRHKNRNENKNENRNENIQMNGSDFWHSDLSYMKIPAYATILYAMDVPQDNKNEGNTIFMNAIKAYDTLSEEKKAFYSKLKAFHNLRHNNGYPLNRIQSTHDIITDDADICHPVIRYHPQTHEKSIFINQAYTKPKIFNIETNEMYDERKSREILDDIFEHLFYDKTGCSEEFILEHEWRNGDILCWDNTCLLHKATTLTMSDNLRRVMLRCCVLCENEPVQAQYD